MLQNKSQTNIFNQSKTRNYKIIYNTQELRIEFNRKTVSASIRKKKIFNKNKDGKIQYSSKSGCQLSVGSHLWSLENFRQIKSWHEITPGEDKLRLAWVGWTAGHGGRQPPGIVSSDFSGQMRLRRFKADTSSSSLKCQALQWN